MMDTSANVAGVGQAIVKPSECESDPEGKWLLFQLADTAGNVGSLLGTLGTSSASDCAKACADNASCTAWVASGRGCNLWSQPPELVVGAMGSTVGIRAAAL